MMPTLSDFSGPIPETYHRCLGQLLFEPYAEDLARRARTLGNAGSLPPRRVLELACGTGIVTRVLRDSLPVPATLLATDLNPAMLDVARTCLPPRSGLAYQQADACNLPFADASFDLLVCQYGVMFFPDKLVAMREARRVLAPGGRYLFNVWDSLEHNPIPATVHQIVTARFPANPPTFLRTPYGSAKRQDVEDTLRAAGFESIACDVLTLPSEAASPEIAARGFIEGTPLRLQLADRGVTDTGELVTAAARELGRKFGTAPCRSTMRAFVFDAA